MLLCKYYIALCCYPNLNNSEKIFGVIIWVQFHFLYIFEGRVDMIHKTSRITMLSYYFFPSDLQSFGDELNSSSKMAPANIWAHKNWSKYLDISNCVFTMNCSTEKKIVFWSFLGRDFICMWEKFQSSQSSNSGYLQKYPIFSTTNVPILFLCLDICIFTSEQTKKNAFGRKMSKM